LKEKLPNPDEGIVTEIESLFEKRFGEKLET
jgi:citrate lyase gamma subunit